MDSFLTRFGDKIKGVIMGFDRIVFKGYHRAITHATGAMNFLRSKNILNKNFKQWALEQSAAIVDSANRFSLAESGRPIEYLNSCNLRKEELAMHVRKHAAFEPDSSASGPASNPARPSAPSSIPSGNSRNFIPITHTASISTSISTTPITASAACACKPGSRSPSRSHSTDGNGCGVRWIAATSATGTSEASTALLYPPRPEDPSVGSNGQRPRTSAGDFQPEARRFGNEQPQSAGTAWHNLLGQGADHETSVGAGKPPSETIAGARHYPEASAAEPLRLDHTRPANYDRSECNVRRISARTYKTGRLIFLAALNASGTKPFDLRRRHLHDQDTPGSYIEFSVYLLFRSPTHPPSDKTLGQMQFKFS